MKKIYTNLVLIASCLLILTSCSHKFNFTTKGLPETDSSYLITTDGKRIEASTIEVRSNNKLKVDGQERTMDDLSAIKTKKMYFGVKDGSVYLGRSYGKICLLYQVQNGTEYTSNAWGSGYANAGPANGGVTAHTVSYKVEYLQKLGSTDIDKLNINTLIDYVSDNDAALSKAKGAKAWHLASYVPAAGLLGGIVWTTIDLVKASKTEGTTPNLGLPLIITGISLPVYFVTAGISNHKVHKAIKIYNKK